MDKRIILLLIFFLLGSCETTMTIALDFNVGVSIAGRRTFRLPYTMMECEGVLSHQFYMVLLTGTENDGL